MAGKIVSRHEASTECSPVSAGERQKRPVIVPVSGAMLDWLVSKQHLAAKERDNDAAIKHAIELLLSAAMGAASYPKS